MTLAAGTLPQAGRPDRALAAPSRSPHPREALPASHPLALAAVQMSGLGEDNYETLSTKTTQYSAKLLKKPDQCRAVARASYMFWSKAGEEPFRNAKRVLECLQVRASP